MSKLKVGMGSASFQMDKTCTDSGSGHSPMTTMSHSMVSDKWRVSAVKKASPVSAATPLATLSNRDSRRFSAAMFTVHERMQGSPSISISSAHSRVSTRLPSLWRMRVS